jgi:hypothetical protein
MALDEAQLAALLQAALDFARQLLVEDGGFVPFGVQARTDGAVEFVQATAHGSADLEGIYRDIGQALASEAREGAILGAALVANSSVEGGAGDGRETAIVAMIEAPGYARSITVPYRLVPADGGPVQVELGAMIAEQGQAVLFPALH